ncbi:MAG: response regulator [Hydrococcus sp. C42_A2020_068]|nr:response regulator [Hydrococcus sp. C42_A2020_068]
MSKQIAKSLEKIPLRLLLLVPFVLQIFAAVGLTGYLSLQNGQKAVNDLASQLQREISSRIDQHLDSYLKTPRAINQINVDAVRLGLLNLGDIKKTGHYFWKQMQAFEDVGYISYVLTTGEYTGAGRWMEGKGVTIDEVSADTKWKNYTYATDSQGNRTEVVFTSDYKPLTESWYTDTVRAGKPIWSQVFPWSDVPDILSISVSYPIYDYAKKLKGVLSVDFRLTGIGDFLRNLAVTPSAKIFILERNGLVLASSSPEKPYKMVNGKAQRLNVLESKDPLIRATADYLRKHFGSFNEIQNSQQLEFMLDGKRQFVRVTPWRDELGLDWLVAIAVPESDFMAQINANTRTTIWLCLGALAIATVLGIYTSRWISRPLLRLSQASQAIASGQLDRQVKVEGVSELRILARSFNQMAKQLRDSFVALQKTNAELETRVEQRTAQFKKAVQAAMKAASESATAKQAAEVANRAKGEFLANISHELRTPLNSVIGYANILMNDRALSPQQAKRAKIIQRSGTYLLTLISDILDFSKAEASKLELEPTNFHFLSFLEEICGIVEMRAQEKKLLFQCQMTGDIPTGVRADEKRLRQVLINLLGNAVKFTDKGQILLKVSEIGTNYRSNFIPHKQIRFEVVDTGVGISPSHLETIFQPFEQVCDRDRKRGGTGLGLAISKQLLELMGSQLQVSSQLQQGSTFWFDLALPVVEIALETQPKGRIKGYQGKPRRILVVGDRQENRSLLLSLLKPLGFEVMMAKNGEQGLTIARQLKPNLILTDIMMSVKTGLTMTREIREIPEIKDVPIIAISASLIEMMEETCLRAGCNAFLSKPIDQQQLLSLLKEYLHLEWIYEGEY